MEEKKLRRKLRNKKVAGVCSGIADYFGIDSTLVRVGWAVFTCFYGAGLIAYLICWIIMPEDKDENISY
jgi:phage shock protein PspC (stress-responsive transcriptional regulator)